MPFASLDMPSLAFGLFSSKFNQLGIDCNVRYLNFDFAEIVGLDNYNFVLQLAYVMAGEQLFAKYVFGDQAPSDNAYYHELNASKNVGHDVSQRLEEISKYIPQYLQHCLDDLGIWNYDIICFSSLFEQNLASLSLAKIIKEMWPKKIIVFGGANCEEKMGVTMHRCFPFIDYVFSGEADKSFPELIQRIHYGHPINGLEGLVWRESGTTLYTKSVPSEIDLNKLPIPNYDDYFIRLAYSSLQSLISPNLLMESARGCWWGEKSHCTFCGLNGLSMKFRRKNTVQAVTELNHLINRYGVHTVRFVDNIIAPEHFKKLLPEISQIGHTVNIIFEVKSNLKKNQIKTLAKSNVTVQAGIESLSSHVLKLMGKGSNTLMNIQTLKWCKQFGVFADWNLLYGFPGETAQDYQRSAKLAALLAHLDPPSGCGPIRLDRFSPNFNNSESIGFTNLRPAKYYKFIYPIDNETLFDLVYYFDFDYQVPINDGGYLQKLEQAIAEWKRRHDTLYAVKHGVNIVIHDTRPIACWTDSVLSGMAAFIYEYCDKARSLLSITNAVSVAFGSEHNNEITDILDDLVRKHLMYSEDEHYISLAVISYNVEDHSSVTDLSRENNPMPHTLPLHQDALTR
jgi:ribosomal peptide maturation radical SAM protein 1